VTNSKEKGALNNIVTGCFRSCLNRK